MNADSEFFIDWIHRLDNGKRLDGFLTEAYFERVLAKKRLGLIDSVFGWMTAALPEDHRTRRYWFRVAPSGYLPGPVERALIESYSRMPASRLHVEKFFFLHPEVTGALVGGRQAPLTFHVTEWGYDEKS